MSPLLSRRALLASAAALATPATAAPKPKAADVAREARRKALAAVKSWGIQLRLINFQTIAAAPVDMVVIDHGFSDGIRFLRQFEPSEIEYLKTGPDGRRRLVISYMSIGEIETYRWYWPEAWWDETKRPAWIGPENPRWPRNYPVNFWEPDWQRIITGPDGYAARIMRQGFDGFYLDRADVYEELLKQHPQGAKTMSAFVSRIASTARAINPEAIVILQNAEALIAEKPIQAAIDAVSKEDLYFGLDHTEAANPRDAIAFAEKDLRRARALDKRVFAIEYVGDPAKQREVVARMSANGFLPYFAPRDLRNLTLDPTTLSNAYTGPLVPQEPGPQEPGPQGSGPQGSGPQEPRRLP